MNKKQLLIKALEEQRDFCFDMSEGLKENSIAEMRWMSRYFGYEKAIELTEKILSHTTTTEDKDLTTTETSWKCPHCGDWHEIDDSCPKAYPYI